MSSYILHIEKIVFRPAPICHHGHASRHAAPCTEEATMMVNGIPYCSRHTHDVLAAFGAGRGEGPRVVRKTGREGREGKDGKTDREGVVERTERTQNLEDRIFGAE